MHTKNEVTLDPQDWEQVRALGHRMVEDMLAHVRDVRSRPVWQPIPASVLETFDAAVPMRGVGADVVYDDFLDTVLPYGLGNIHPRFWGWVIGTGTFTGALAEMLSASMNTNAAGFDTSAIHLERQVLGWFRTLFGMPSDGSGILVSGASQANYVGLAAALAWKLGPAFRAEGVLGSEGRPMIYASDQTHFSVKRAIRLLGLGDASYRAIPSTSTFAIDTKHLAEAIAEDRERGRAPAIVVGNAGTVGVGAFDNCDELADIAKAEGLWLHVDGAFGAMLALTPDYVHRVAGMERADSLVFDLHKWLHVPIEAACVLIRDADAHQQAFSVDGAYIRDMPEGPATGVNRFTNLGVQQSRSARAVKVWFSMREHGVEKLGECVAMNVQQAEWLAARIAEEADFELLAPVRCNIVCFRYTPASIPEVELNGLNETILCRLQAEGIALPTAFSIAGQYAIRCCITNHRTTYDDLEFLLSSLRQAAQDLMPAALSS